MDRALYSAEHRYLVELLREAREGAGLTQVELAKRLDVPQPFVSRYESGQRRLDLVELRSICRELGIEVVELVERWETGIKGGRRRSRK